MILAAKINAAIDDDRRAVDFKSRFVIANQRSIVPIETVEMMVEAARQNLVIQDYRRRFHAALAAEFPNHAAVIVVQAIDVTIGRWKIDAVVANRRLPRPGCATPGILVQAAAHEFRLHIPDDLQLAIFPWTGAVKISLTVAEPHRHGGRRFWLWFFQRRGRRFADGLSAGRDERQAAY